MKLTKKEQQLRNEIAKEMWINDSQVSIDLVFEWANTFIEERKKQHEKDEIEESGNWKGTPD